jgi:hypothetical protein
VYTPFGFVPIHPVWSVMMMVGWNLGLTSMTPKFMHPFIDAVQESMVRGFHADM